MIRLRRVPATALAAGALLAFTACGGSSPSAGPATRKPSATSPSQTASPSAAASSSARSAAPETNPAGDIPDNQQYVAFTAPSGLFTVKVPEGWARTTAGSSGVLFTDKLNTVQAQWSARPAAPTTATARAEVASIKAATSHFSGGTVEQARRHAGTAVLTRYRADAPPDAVTGKVRNDDVERYEFWHAGQLVTLTLAGPHGADNVDPWRIVTDSFRWGR